ncbi:MAG: glutamine amidotransferase [Planctomycetota bacterium]|nr:glutamine amidotransferase [Planctomycetota bacterium]MDA1251748.1 glutamine amidotransferase [Planctomycetota bacterium]
MSQLLATLLFRRTEWIVPAVIIGVAAGYLIWWSSRRVNSAQKIRVLASLLKVTGIALLVVCLLEPVWSGFQPEPHSNLFLVLADNSRSLTVQSDEASDEATLATQVKKTLTDEQAEWTKRLEQDFELHRFAFDRQLRSVSNFVALKNDGETSSLQAALASLAQQFEDRPVGGVLLFTDGNATDMTEADLARLFAARPTAVPPIYPVVYGETDSKPDLTIENVSISQTPFEDAPVSVQCNVTARSLGEGGEAIRTVKCRLVDSDGAEIESARMAIDESTTQLPFRFQFRPIKTGVTFYRLEVTGVTSPEDGEEPVAVEEATAANNSRVIQIDRGSRELRVLYVSGRPNWEFKFLNRALAEDEQVQLVGMIRVAKREAKFDFRGRDGQTSNSIFSGFKKEGDEETENYDEPVLVRLNTKDKDELRGGFPKEAKELFQFDALVLDDIEAKFFNQDQLDLIERFVSHRGGGLLMLGGQETFHAGDYDRTPVADVLPVYLDRASYPDGDIKLKLMLTREGWLQPWVRLRANESDERQRLHDTPGFKTLNAVRGIKPGASVLARVTDGSANTWPALVTQQFGRGRSAALLVGDLWRWQIKRIENHPDDLYKSWRQTVRWLVADVPGRVELSTQSAVDVAPEAARLVVRVTDEEYGPLDNAKVKIRVVGPLAMKDEDNSETDETDPAEEVASDDSASEKDPKKEGVLLDAEPSNEHPGMYSTVFVPKESGAYRFVAEVVDGDGEALAPAEAGWIHAPVVGEFQSIGVNRSLLEKLAKETGGEIVQAKDLDDFVSDLSSKPMPVMTAWTMPLWDSPFVFLVVMACLLGEWGLRRSKGLP